MVDADPTKISTVQLQPLPNFQFADPLVFSVEIIASVLAIVVALYFYRFYRLTGFLYLLGLTIGFIFITFAEVLLAVDVWLEFNPDLFNLLFWMRLLSLSYGFSFLAISYYYKRKEDYRTIMFKVAALSAIPIMGVMAVMIIAPPALDFPPYNVADEYFRVFNLIMLAYVFRSTLNSIVEQGRKELVYIPAAFAVLWIGQFSGLIFSLDVSVSAFISQLSAKLLGLLLFALTMSQVQRGKRVPSTQAAG
jgi:hypothetical protein